MLCYYCSKLPTVCQHFFREFLDFFYGLWKS
nr:MAG TPA: hypothetical protein [Caudoviricetes sp.]